MFSKNVPGEFSWQRVKNSPHASLNVYCGYLKNVEPLFVYNVVMEIHHVIINGTVLADWEENDDDKVYTSFQK